MLARTVENLRAYAGSDRSVPTYNVEFVFFRRIRPRFVFSGVYGGYHVTDMIGLGWPVVVNDPDYGIHGRDDRRRPEIFTRNPRIHWKR